MKILAVVPARAGSKRIPNKNMRLIGNMPLVAYSIENALSSKYITDVIVSTDSFEVAIVAEQKGVAVRWRPQELCNDDVTLDSVVWDAITFAEESFDYVVTLQPTSPTLRHETLDKALEIMLENNCDTLISVSSQPGLSWLKGEKNYYPEYGQRLNSQYLPPHYCESGAFLISKIAAISPDSRIGKRVEIFETSSDEALSIQTFEDLVLARQILDNASVSFFVNGNNSIGMGHISRVMELVDEFYLKPTIYYDYNTTNKAYFGDTSYDLIGVDGCKGLFNQLASHPCTVFINDILSTSEEYMSDLKKVIPHARIINFEDEGAGAIYADLVFNALLDKSKILNARIGSDYYIAPKLFLLYQPIEIMDKVDNVLISFGGADPQNYTDRVLEIISNNKEKYSKYNFYVVLGPAKKPVHNLEKYSSMNNIKIYRNISNMPEIMSRCDIAVSSRGRTCYELAVLGIPTISISENSREETHSFLSHDNGFHYLGFQPSDKMIESNLDLYLILDKEERREIQNRLLRTDLRNGRRRVVGLIRSI